MEIERYVLKFKNGNQDAFNVIYKETFSFVRFVIYSYVQNKETIEDLIQETYMKVTQRIQDYHANNFNNWIYTIAKNVAIDYVRKKKEICLEHIDFLADRETHPYLHYALNHLDDNLKEIFLMKVLCGHTTKKIASILNLSPSIVNQRYYQAKEMLKRSLEEGFYETEKI